MRLRVKGCCCLSLRTGGLVQALLAIIGLVYLIFRTSKSIMNYDPILISLYDFKEHNNPQTLNELYVMLMIYIIDILVEAVLLAGIVFDNHKLLLPWLILKAIGSVLLVPGLVIFLIIAGGEGAEAKVLVLTGLIGAAIIVFSWWCWVIIYSLYFEIRDMDNQASHNEMQVAYVENGNNHHVQPYQHLNT